MDLLINLLSPGTRAALNIFTTILMSTLFLILTWYGTKVTWEQFEFGYFTSTPLMFPTGPLMAIIPFGFILLFIQSLRMLLGYIRELAEIRSGRG
jgi:TRAP-type C4-dicarboxylate transport system permease small subunit